MNYVDKYGRWHTKPVTEENPLPTNNAYIYSFYAGMVGLPVEFKEGVPALLVIINDRVMNRHPGVVPPDGVPISHDEYVGLAGLNQVRAKRIVEYGEANHWQICDIPGFTPTPFRKLVMDDVFASYEGLANEENPRTAVIKYPAIWPVAFWHRPEQQYFYYRCAGRSPGTFRTIYFILATLVSIFSREKSSPMWYFKTLKFKEIGPNIWEKALIKLTEKYGKTLEICKNYFPEGHPILARVVKLHEK